MLRAAHVYKAYSVLIEEHGRDVLEGSEEQCLRLQLCVLLGLVVAAILVKVVLTVLLVLSAIFLAGAGAHTAGAATGIPFVFPLIALLYVLDMDYTFGEWLSNTVRHADSERKRVERRHRPSQRHSKSRTSIEKAR